MPSGSFSTLGCFKKVNFTIISSKMKCVFWHRHTRALTYFTYFLYSTPPSLNIACAKKSIGYMRGIGYRAMTLHQCFYCSSNWENAIVTDTYRDFMNSDLYWCQCCIIKMDYSIVYGFSDCCLWKMICFNPCNIFI